MRLLLDECVPRPLLRDLTGHDAHHVVEMGWSSKRNGKLLALMLAECFAVHGRSEFALSAELASERHCRRRRRSEVLMSSFPSRPFTLRSPLPAADLLARLRAATEKPRWVHRSHRHRIFQGIIDGNRFDVRRIIHERNSNLPRIVGTVIATAEGASIVGTMRPQPWVRPFLVGWLTFATLACLATVFIQAVIREFHLFPTIVSTAMLGIGIGALRYQPRDFFRQTAFEIRALAELVEASGVEWAKSVTSDD